MITTIVLFFVGFFFFSDHKHLVSRWCTFESMFVCQIREVWFAKNSGDISCQIWFFFLGCVWQILYFIKTELPLNIKGKAIWNNPLQDTVLLYIQFLQNTSYEFFFWFDKFSASPHVNISWLRLLFADNLSKVFIIFSSSFAGVSRNLQRSGLSFYAIENDFKYLIPAKN